jgi:molecular chaperone GrpE
MSTKNETDKLNEQLDPEKTDDLHVLEHPSYKQLMEKLNETEVKANDYWNTMLRAKAELENIARRTERDITNAHKYALEKFASELLTVIDSLEQGLFSCKEALNKNPENNTLLISMCNGMELTTNMFLSVCKKFGIEQLNPLGDDFNPELHQAISTIEDPSAKPNTIIQILQKGYLLNGRLIRPALVTVTK